MKSRSSKMARLQLASILVCAVALGLYAAGCDLPSGSDAGAQQSGLTLQDATAGAITAAAVEPVLRDGGESTGLGAPGVATAAGSGIVVGGTGAVTLPSSFMLNVPGTVQQALLYWSGEHRDGGADDTIDVEFNGGAQSVLGTLIGGPEFFFFFEGDVFLSTYRADVTGFVLSGANTIEVTGMDFDMANLGVGLLVIFDDGPDVKIDIRDGQDLAFAGFAPPLDATVPQTYNFAPSAGPRNASLHIFASDVAAGLANRIQIDVAGQPTEFIDNLLTSTNGPLWDTHTLSVAIPAGADSVTVEVISFDDGSGALPASLAWHMSALTIVQPDCGDGVVGPGEECDDANTNNFDDCRNDCTLPICGNGIVDPGEQCDDANTNDFDDCRNDCTLPICGDGIVDPGEVCDDANTNDFDECPNDCGVSMVCGDGIVDPGEQCDDANTNNFDDCRNDCTLPFCGDGIVDPGEQCDDANTNDFDECPNDCAALICGDGIIDPGEQCDDANTNNFDDCRNDCTLPVCGDGIVDPGEECDDGNNDAGDGCSPTCDEEAPARLQGCGIGFWKNHPDAWPPTGFDPDQTLDSVFTFPAALSSLGGTSLDDALRSHGGPSLADKAAIMLRHAVAALLCASHPGNCQTLTAQDVIDTVNAALATENKSTILGLKNDLDSFNNAGCPSE